MRCISTVLVSLAVLAIPIQTSAIPLEMESPTAMPVAHVLKHRSATQKRYLKLYWRVVRHRNRRAPGRNLVTRGIVVDGHVRKARASELRPSIARFERWLAPPAPPATVATGASQSAGGSTGGYAIPASIVMCESHGDSSAVNTANPDRPAGLYQITTPTWLANGGGKYAPTADLATPQQQGEIAGAIYDGGAGRSQWEC